jgi:hypothetical protein
MISNSLKGLIENISSMVGKGVTQRIMREANIRNLFNYILTL